MSREIKFRGWHTGLNKMFSAEEMGRDQLTIMPDGKGFINVSGTDTRLSQLVPHMIPMQYTGFKDKKGVEVYDGDIIRYALMEGLGMPERRGLTRIIKTDHLGSIGSYDTDVEVIGNRYENPELLNQFELS